MVPDLLKQAKISGKIISVFLLFKKKMNVKVIFRVMELDFA